MGRGKLGAQRGSVQAVGDVCRARVRLQCSQVGQRIGRNACHLHQPVARDMIRCDEADLRAQFRTHVAQGHALLHRQRHDRIAAKLHRLVGSAVHAELRDGRQHHVFGAHASGQCPAPVQGDGLRHPQPDFSGDDYTQHFGAANAKHVGAKRAAGGGMRVTPHTKHARADVPMLRHHHMANALAVIHMRQVLLARPVAGDAHDPA